MGLTGSRGGFCTVVLGMVPPACMSQKGKSVSLACQAQKALLPTTKPFSEAKDSTLKGPLWGKKKKEFLNRREYIDS